MGHKKPTFPLNQPITCSNPFLSLILCIGHQFRALLHVVTRFDHIEVNGFV